MNEIVNQAKKLVIPSKKMIDEKEKVADLVLELVKKQTLKYKEIVDVEFGGSYAKGTWLPDKADIDVFVKFEKDVSEKLFVNISKKIGFDSLKEFKPYARYSEHPYVEAIVKNTRVNVVPCYDVELGKWQSSADRSSFHTKFMLKELSEQMKVDVRLLKKFLKSNKIYGAEIAKEGISGYVCEVLILHYGTFQQTIDAISKICSKEIIGKATKEFDTPIIIMDPIDSNRNLAAAISNENIGKFILAARAFLQKPSLNFFKTGVSKKQKLSFENIIVIKFNYSKRAPDVIWGQVKRAASAVSVQLELEGFRVLRKSAVTDEKNEAAIIFLLESILIPRNRLKEGPEFFSEDDTRRFIEKNKKSSKLMWVSQNKRVAILQERKFYDAKKFLQYSLKKELSKSGIPKGLHLDMKKGFKIMQAATSKSIKEAVSELVNTDEKIFSSSK
jgi:tRNA nucleotidyltransferase (CCA-adding enzyme)